MRDAGTFAGPNGGGGGSAESDPQSAPMLTNRATAVLAEAVQLARRTRQEAVSTEHLLLALLAEPGAVPTTLDALGVDRAALTEKLETSVAAAAPAVSAAPHARPSLAAMRQTLQLADMEARHMRQPLGPEHLLLGLLALDEGAGPALLRAGGASLEGARALLAPA